MIPPAGLPLLVYVAGSLLGWHCPEWRNLFLTTVLFCVPPALILFLACRQPHWKLLPLLPCLALLAALRVSLRLEPAFSPDHLVHHATGQPLLLEGVLVRQPEVRAAFTRLAFEDSRVANQLVVVRDGEEALEYLFGSGRYADRDLQEMPQLILLDLKLPKGVEDGTQMRLSGKGEQGPGGAGDEGIDESGAHAGPPRAAAGS